MVVKAQPGGPLFLEWRFWVKQDIIATFQNNTKSKARLYLHMLLTLLALGGQQTPQTDRTSSICGEQRPA